MMKKKERLLLFLISLAFFSLLALIQKVPGYMDAEYYFGQAIHVSQGHGYSELFIWNFLNDPAGIPAQGFTFWLPLTSLIASAGLSISRSNDFLMARVLFVLLAACVPVITAAIADHFLPGKRAGWLAGGLALFSGFYLPYLTITDNFTPFMFLGGIFTLLAIKINAAKSDHKREWLLFLALGVIAGLMTLTRSEGILWLAGGFLVLLLCAIKRSIRISRILESVVSLLAGFLVVMAPWYFHNISLFEGLYPPGNRIMFWMTGYDDLFIYPAQTLTADRWLASGLPAILSDRIQAFGSNLQTLIATGSDIILFPLLIVGYWKNRRHNAVNSIGIILLMTFIIMTLLFPYAGERGGFFHSLSSMQPLLWGLIAVGLDGVIQWGVKRRNWKYNRAWLMFGVAVVLAAGALSGLIMTDKMIHGLENDIPWNNSQNAFLEIEQGFKSRNIGQNETIMINDPPGFTLATGRQSVMIPTGGASSVLAVCERYDVRYLVVNDERHDVQKLLDEDPAMSGKFVLIVEISGSSIYEYKR